MDRKQVDRKEGSEQARTLEVVPRTFEMVQIGIAHTPLKERREAPQQPGPVGRSHEQAHAQGAVGRVEIHAPYRDCLADLQSFSHAWLLFVFDRNQGWKARVKPPRGGARRGLFATRGPHRPTSIGMTAVRILCVNKTSVEVSGVDLLDGTPIVDIKPYLAFTDSHPEATIGWLAQVPAAPAGEGEGEQKAMPARVAARKKQEES